MPKPFVVASALVLSLAIGASIWVYVAGTKSLRAQAKEQGIALYAEGAQSARSTTGASTNPPPLQIKSQAEQAIPRLLKQVDDWTLKVTVATAAGGAGLMLVMSLGMALWRQAWVSRIAMRGATLEQESQQYARQLQVAQSELDEAQIEARHQTALRAQVEGQLRTLQQDFDKRIEERTGSLTKSLAALEKELSERTQVGKTLAHQRQELERSKDVLEMAVQVRTQELQKLQRRYENILSSAGEGIYGLDLQGKTTFVNPAAAKLTGWSVEELIGKPEIEVFHRSHSAPVQNGETQFRMRDDAAQPDVIFHRKDGASFPVEYVRTPIMEKERMVGAVVIFKDITERKRTEEALGRKAAELARSNAELEQFAYVASHDLQEPLRKIQAFGDRLKTKCDAVKLDEGRDYLERMQSAAARMQTLINDLLTFSRVISTSEPFAPVDLAAVTQEVLTDLEVRIERTKAKVEVGALPTIDADPLQMRQLLQNLIGNALKFQAPGAQPLVTISAEIVKRPFAAKVNPSPDDEICELTIRDNGIGFEEKYLDKIFTMFQRLHGRTEFEGTGVGLAVCRRITDRHGGTITAASKLGEGATFTVSLPARQPKGEKPV